MRASADNTLDTVLVELRAKARPDQLEGMARFGITGSGRLGVSVPDLRKIAKGHRREHALALGLWETGIPDAMILASMVDDPVQVTAEQMDAWVADFQSWDVCDQVCMNLFDRTPHALAKVREWAERDEEFVRRAAFALIACVAWHDKSAADDVFVELLPVIETGADDERNFVKKAVSWALRHIGKRNATLHPRAIACAERIERRDGKAARWVARDVLRELRSEAVRERLGLRG